MPICLDLCFDMLVCLDLCFLHALCYLSRACALHAMFVCLDLSYVCHAMCYCSPFVALSFFFSCVLAYWFRPNLDPMVFVTVHTLRPIPKGLDHPTFHVYACLSLCLISMLASLDLGFAMLDALSGFEVVWLYLTPIRPCLDVTIEDASPWCPVALCTPFPFAVLCDDMLTMLVCVTCWLSMHLYMLAYMSMHESCLLVCHP